MDKEHWSILIGILVLIVSSIGVYITYQAYFVVEPVEPVEPVEDIDFFVGDVTKETGRDISWYLSISGGELVYGKKIIEEEPYYIAPIFITNRGKRAHNVRLEFWCEDIDFYGIIKSPDADYEIQRSDWSTVLYFPEVDAIKSHSWDIIFRVDNDINELTCNMEYVSEDMGQKTKHVVENFEIPLKTLK